MGRRPTGRQDHGDQTVTEFHERPFAARYAAMGDRAETAFSSLHPKAHRMGFNRPSMNLGKMTATMRYTPDYLTEDGAFEVMGFSSRGNAALKLKCEKLDALQKWDMLMPTFLWVFDSARNRCWQARISVWGEACQQHAERMFFPDNMRPYWNLGIDRFPAASIQLAAA
jgi:hypothetical protein